MGMAAVLAGALRERRKHFTNGKSPCHLKTNIDL